MELLDLAMKKEMEKCKRIAKDAGLRFSNDTLEYIVTNRDMLELAPKSYIPTMYDYWVHDVEAMIQVEARGVFPTARDGWPPCAASSSRASVAWVMALSGFFRSCWVMRSISFAAM